MILNEERIIRKQLIKNMVYNFIIFSIIFTIFGIAIFNTVKSSVYQSSTRELELAKERFLSGNQIKGPRPTDVEKQKEEKFEKEESFSQINPRVTYLIRNEAGEISNTDKIGRLYDEYGDSIYFNATDLDRIYEMKLNNQYSYRGVNLKVEENGEVKYIQLLINVDSEKNLMDNYFGMLLIGILIIILLSIIASYLLSKRALNPIIQTWKKQTEFVQNASHELRTPLTIIQTKQELLLQEPESKIIDRSEDIMLTLNEAKRLSKMTKDLMVLARADSNQVNLQKEEIQIDDFIHKIVVPYREYAKLEEKEMELKLEYGSNLKIDVNQFHQVIVILLDNAIKYTKEKEKITIHTYAKENKFILEVADTGIGISEEGLKHVFERFYREDRARSRKTGGSGLGLSIAQSIVQLHKGNIKITNNTPKGTIVTIRLPKG